MSLPHDQILSDKRHRRGDLRLIAQAVRRGWVPPDRRDEILRLVDEVVGDEGATAREIIAAGRVLVAMEAENQRIEHAVIRRLCRSGLPEQTVVLRASFDE